MEVPGKDPRLCIDYRKLNAITKTQYFPVPNLDQRVKTVARAQFITLFDLARGFLQCPLTERAKGYAAFTTCQGVFRPLRLPFGAKNSHFSLVC